LKDRKTVLWVLKMVRKHIPAIVTLIFANSIHAFMGVAFAFACKEVINFAIAGNFDLFIKALLSLVYVILGQIFFSAVSQYLSVRTTARIEMKLKEDLFRAILKKDYQTINKFHSGELLTRLTSDISIVASAVVSLVPGAVALVTRLVFALGALIYMDKQFALILFVGGVLLLGIVSFMRKVLKKMHKTVQETDGRVRSFFQEAISSSLMIKVFNLNDRINTKGNALQIENYKAQSTRNKISVLSHGGMGLVFNAGYLYAFGWSAYRLFLNSTGVVTGFTYGDFTAILQLVNQVQSPFAAFSGIISRYYSAVASAERIMEIHALPNEKKESRLIKKAEYESLERLVFEQVSFKYDDDEEILLDCNFTIDKNDFVVISGLSGIGKSTLLKLLLGVVKPSAGGIFIDFKEERIPANKNTRALFSYVPQGNFLLSGTIRDNVKIVKERAKDEDVLKAIEVACGEFVYDLPDGLDTVIGEKGLGLSEGQVQRLAIARAILSNAPVILLDEATSALDEETEERLLRNLRNLHNKTCIIISHKKAAYEICNKEIVIKDQNIIMNTIDK